MSPFFQGTNVKSPHQRKTLLHWIAPASEWLRLFVGMFAKQIHHKLSSTLQCSKMWRQHHPPGWQCLNLESGKNEHVSGWKVVFIHLYLYSYLHIQYIYIYYIQIYMYTFIFILMYIPTSYILISNILRYVFSINRIKFPFERTTGNR